MVFARVAGRAADVSLNLATPLRESAKQHAERIALVRGERSYSYADLHDAVQRAAGALIALGLERGKHVALLLPNVPEFTIAYFAAHYVGCPVVPLNVLLTPDEIAYHLDDSDAVALIAAEALLPQAQAAVTRVDTCRHLIVTGTGDAPAGTLRFDALLAAGAPCSQTAATDADDTAVILYTSGTTGKPKGAELTHANLLLNAHVVTLQLVPLTPDTVALGVLPLFHSFGQTVVQNAVLAAGGSIVLMPKFDAAAAMALMEKHRVSFLAGVPTMYFALLNHPDASRYDLSALRHCVSGGASLPVEVLRRFDARYEVAILEGYGLSETSPVASFNLRDRERKPGSVGLPVWGCEMRVVDEARAEIVEPFVPGEIEIKGHNVMRGYWKKPEATAASLREGWFASGDIGHRDADGYYFVVDRKKDMIRGGYNVYPREIEEVLYAHPAVAEAAVIGVRDPRLGEEIKAVIAKRAGHETTTAQDIVDYCREHLAAYKHPRLVEFVPSLPKGPTGKILKRELRG
jgi:long-chain acyl-CoA synthetase